MGYIAKERARYRVRFRDPIGRVHSKSFVRKGDADKYLREAETNEFRGRSDDNNRFDLSKRARLRSMYQIVLTEGSTADVVAFVNRELLLGVWDELWLSPAVHEAWDSWIQAYRAAAV